MVNYEFIDEIAFLEMNRPEKLNTFNNDLCNSLIEGLIRAYKEEAHAVVIKAKCKGKVWSAGHDIQTLPLDGSDPLSFDSDLTKLLRAVQNIPIPVIAYVDGTVWGGACDLCLSCDMIVASDTATFAITPAKIGIPYNASGIMHFINQLGINKAREMFFTGNPISAEDALNVGLLNHISPIEDLPALLEEKILSPLRRNSVLSVSAIKRQFRILARATSTISAENFERINNWREKVYKGADYREGINAFLEKRKPEFKGHVKDLDMDDYDKAFDKTFLI